MNFYADAESNSGLTSLAYNDCGCPGLNESFVCNSTVNEGDVNFIQWTGSALSHICARKPNLTLSHGFDNDGCNTTNGVFGGYCVDVNCSISQLNVTLSQELNNLSVDCCALYEGVDLPVQLGSIVLNVSSKSSENQ